jgi:hypothetical protein
VRWLIVAGWAASTSRHALTPALSSTLAYYVGGTSVETIYGYELDRVTGVPDPRPRRPSTRWHRGARRRLDGRSAYLVDQGHASVTAFAIAGDGRASAVAGSLFLGNG